VTARSRGETLEVVIADDGTGMDGETLRCVQDHLESPSGRSAEPPLLHDDERGIGLANVHERLVSFGGAGSGLTVTSALGAGTKVTMQIRRSQ
ncbi:MAG: sensor histidine kinase, partial [Spirochaetales bacterium]